MTGARFWLAPAALSAAATVLFLVAWWLDKDTP